MRNLRVNAFFIFFLLGAFTGSVLAQTPAQPAAALEPTQHSQLPAEVVTDYQVGINDVLEVTVLQPEPMQNIVTVAPDGSITFPYIGTVPVKGRSLAQVQEDIQKRLADGYMKYPVVVVSLKESRSRRFFVYGEVLKPGPYQVEENTTVLRAISMAGGFTRFGSSSRVKVLRTKKEGAGYDIIKVNIKAVMDGNPDEDVVINQGDIVVVSEGVF